MSAFFSIFAYFFRWSLREKRWQDGNAEQRYRKDSNM